jgi:DNA-binding HxlR family transcriptional regulator
MSQLRRIFPQASKNMLAQHLRETEREGLTVRTDLSDRVRHVD